MGLFFCFNDTQKVSSGYLLGIMEQNDTGHLRKTECRHFVSISYRLLCFAMNSLNILEKSMEVFTCWVKLKDKGIMYAR
jgi:hypothetical protein